MHSYDARSVTAAYAAAFRRLRELPGFDHKAVLLAEAGSILKRWAGETKVASKQDASLRARYRAGKRAFGYTNVEKNPFGITVNTGRRGGIPGLVWHKNRGGFSADQRSARRKAGYAATGVFQLAGHITNSGRFVPSHVHWKNEVWARINSGAQLYSETLRALLRIAPQTVGRSRQSVIQIADSLGIDLTKIRGQGVSAAGIAKARRAIAANGKSYNNGTGYEGGDEVRAYVQLLNRLPYAHRIGMDRTLAVIIANRAKFIEKAYEKGAFDSIKRAARAFPNIIKAESLA